MPSWHLPRRQASLRDPEDQRSRHGGRCSGVGPGADLPHQGLQPAPHGQGLLRSV